MLQLLLEARRNDENKRGKVLNISEEELTAQVMIFFLGGFETVATSLCFAVHELAVNQDIQDRLRAEIDEMWKEQDGKLTIEDISKMKYLDMVVSGKANQCSVLHSSNWLVVLQKIYVKIHQWS